MVGAGIEAGAAGDTYTFLNIRENACRTYLNGFHGACPDAGITGFTFTFIKPDDCS
jgi:hypothetical protein